VFSPTLNADGHPSSLVVTSSTNTAYTVIGTYFFNDEGTTILDVKFGGYMDSTATSYDVRIYNPSTREVIAETNFTNTSFDLQSLGTISNNPTEPILLEIHLKKNGPPGTSVYCSTVLFYW
jgi:hypothetical protein